jgi:helix-turn-helix protein
MTEEGNYYTVNEAAQILELSPACVRQMLRAGELEGERREERIEGVLGPWRIPKRTVRILREDKPDVLRSKRRKVCAADATTAGPPLDEATTVDVLPEEALANEISADTPSEASELLSESVREVRETAEGLREDLERLEGYLEQMEITETALREGLRREKERGDRERERAERLRVELEEERARRGREPQEF